MAASAYTKIGLQRKALTLLLVIVSLGSATAFSPPAKHARGSLSGLSMRQQFPRPPARQLRRFHPPVFKLPADAREDQAVSGSPEDVILNVDAKDEDNPDEDVLRDFEDPLIQLQKDCVGQDALDKLDGLDAVDEDGKDKGTQTLQDQDKKEENGRDKQEANVKYMDELEVRDKEEPIVQVGGARNTKDEAERTDQHKREETNQEGPIEHEEKGNFQNQTEQIFEQLDGQNVYKEDRKNVQQVKRTYEPAGIFSPAYEGTRRYVSADWIKNLKSLPTSLTLKRIRSPLLFNAVVTLVTCVIHHFFGALSGLPALPHQLLGGALSLLLVFRNNNAYTRFWEARTQWGIVTRECRELAALSTAFMTPKQALPMLGLISAYPHVMMNYLRGERDMKMVERLVDKQEVEALKVVLNQPQYVLTRLRLLAFAAQNAGVDARFRDSVIPRVFALGDTVSNCERIFNTPIPLHYSRHLSRFLTIYLSTLPLVLIGSLGWKTLPVMAVLCWALLGIQEIGNMIEEPFSAIDDELGRALLPMKEICRTIRRDVRAIAATEQIAQDFKAPTITSSNPSFIDNVPKGLKDLFQFFDQDSYPEEPFKDGPQAI